MPTDAPSTAAIVGKAVRGAAWTISTGIGSRALGLIGTLWLTYFLAPDIQGEVSDGFIIVLTAHQLSMFGATPYLIAHPESGREAAWNVTVFQFAAGLLALCVAIAIRDPCAVWLKAPEMGQYVPGLALAMFLERAGATPQALLAKRLQFGRIGVARTAGEVAYTISSVALAMRGLGGMSIVYGNVLRAGATFAIIAAGVPRRDWLTPSLPSAKTMRPVLAYGLPLSVGSFATFASRRWDNLIVSGLFGSAVVGQYNLAYNLADIPAIQVGEQIGDVLLPSFAQMREGDRKAALLRATGLLSLVAFPLAVGLGAIGPSLVDALLRPEWSRVGAMLMVLSALSVARPLGWTIYSYLQATNRPRAAMWVGLAKVVLLVTCLVTIGRFGPLWACGAVGVAFSLHSLMSMAIVHRLDGIRVQTFLLRSLPVLVACALMAAAIFAARHVFASAGLRPGPLELVLEIVVGAAAYVASAFIVARPLATEFVSVVGSAILRRRSGDHHLSASIERTVSSADMAGENPSSSRARRSSTIQT